MHGRARPHPSRPPSHHLWRGEVRVRQVDVDGVLVEEHGAYVAHGRVPAARRQAGGVVRGWGGEQQGRMGSYSSVSLALRLRFALRFSGSCTRAGGGSLTATAARTHTPSRRAHLLWERHGVRQHDDFVHAKVAAARDVHLRRGGGGEAWERGGPFPSSLAGGPASPSCPA